ncbi:MAG: BatD family protein [Sulfurimonas sp.]|nr:BatD family protein [Sulfurimonas sp.]
MKNLGKIILILLITNIVALASVKATLDSSSVEAGELVTYSLHLSGSNIKRPIISSLCGVNVVATSSQASVEIINGNTRRSHILSYQFIPRKSCVIDAVEVEIDSHIETSNSVELIVSKVVANKDSDFILVLKSSKKEVYVGETFEVDLFLKQKRNVEAVDSKFVAPILKGFWIKSESKPKRIDSEKYTTTKITYKMAAQRVGQLSITPAQLQIASRTHIRDSWGSWIPKIKWKTYFSNELIVDVKKLPADVSLVGDFNIVASVDKTQINSNEAINLTIKVQGNGNLEDIKSFKPYIDGVNIFDEKIVIKENILTQKIVFVGDSDFLIKPFTLKYFNPTTKEIKTISTDAIDIKVKNSKAQTKLIVEKEQVKPVEKVVLTKESEVPKYWFVLVFVLGLASGVFIMLLKSYKFKTKKQVVSIKEPKILLVKFLPYKHNEDVRAMMDILERNIYEDAKIEVDKKLLRELVKKYDIS